MVKRYAVINQAGDKVENVIAVDSAGLTTYQGRAVVDVTGTRVGVGDGYDGTRFTQRVKAPPPPQRDPADRKAAADALKSAPTVAKLVEYLQQLSPEDFA